jgi:hypothetical protein
MLPFRWHIQTDKSSRIGTHLNLIRILTQLLELFKISCFLSVMEQVLKIAEQVGKITEKNDWNWYETKVWPPRIIRLGKTQNSKPNRAQADRANLQAPRRSVCIGRCWKVNITGHLLPPHSRKTCTSEFWPIKCIKYEWTRNRNNTPTRSRVSGSCKLCLILGNYVAHSKKPFPQDSKIH